MPLMRLSARSACLLLLACATPALDAAAAEHGATRDRAARVASPATASYVRAVQAAVMQNWQRPDDAGVFTCPVRIAQVEGGTVVSVALQAGCPDAPALRASIERAIARASPLPYAGHEAVFERVIVLTFRSGAD